MRLIFYSFITILIFGCKQGIKNTNDLEVISAYIELNLNREKFDLRIYNPPLPPEEDSTNYEVGIKHDSILDEIGELKVYLNSEIVFEREFKIDLQDSIKSFLQLKKEFRPILEPQTIQRLDFRKKQGIKLEIVDRDKFLKIYPDIKFNDNYGGLLSFQNLYFSNDGKKAYFEIVYFKSRLNSSTKAVFAEFKSGEWFFNSYMLSIS